MIHRDLKPSNLLVTEQDDGPVPKVIDFGIAKVLDEAGEAAAALTREGLPDRHPALHEPGAGARHLERDRRAQRRLRARRRPVRAADRRAALRHRRHLAARRRCDWSARRRRGRSARSCRRDGGSTRTSRPSSARRWPRTRRSATRAPPPWPRTSSGFLASQPILARPPSAAYQLRKLIARNRVPSALVAGMVVLLVGFGVAMSVLYVRAEANRKRAVVAEGESQQVTGLRHRPLRDLPSERVARQRRHGARDPRRGRAGRSRPTWPSSPRCRRGCCTRWASSTAASASTTARANCSRAPCANAAPLAGDGTLAEAAVLTDLGAAYRNAGRIARGRFHLPAGPGPPPPAVAGRRLRRWPSALANLGWIRALQGRLDEPRRC